MTLLYITSIHLWETGKTECFLFHDGNDKLVLNNSHQALLFIIKILELVKSYDKHKTKPPDINRLNIRYETQRHVADSPCTGLRLKLA